MYRSRDKGSRRVLSIPIGGFDRPLGSCPNRYSSNHLLALVDLDQVRDLELLPYFQFTSGAVEARIQKSLVP